MSNPRRPGIVAGRYLWGGIALIALLLLGLVSVLSARSVESAETSARQRAERTVADVLLGELSPRLASDDIVGTERRELLEVVQARILTDDRVARVRIWRPDGALIFSAPRDGTSELVAEDDLQFAQAADGVPASVVVEASGAAGPLLQTFVPLRVPDGTTPYAVAQIDHRYGAIEAEANRIWRPVQIVLVIALGVSAVLFVLSFVGGRAARPVGEPRPMLDEGRVRDAEEPAREAEKRVVSDAEGRARAAEERASAAERIARKAEQRRDDAERRLKEASTRLIPPDVLARIDELETNLSGEVAERERSAGEVQRLRSDLEAKEAELALAREGAAAPEAKIARSAELVAKADQRAADAERRVGEAEQRAADAADRGARSDARVSELETALRQAEERAAQAASDAERAERDRDSRSAKDLRSAKRETNALKKKLAEVEASLADARAKLTDRERAAPESGAAGLEVELLRAERDVATADLLRARQELETMRALIAEMEARRRDEIA